MDRVLKAARASGSLNLSNRSLSEVPNEVYQSLEAVGTDEKWWEAVELQKLILAHNNIESLKEDLRNLPQLIVLNASHNKLTELPAAIGELPMLKSLDISFNSILNIPEEIGSATSLVGEYKETIGTCLVFTEEEVIPEVHEETGPSEANLFSGKCIIDPNQTPSKHVKPVAQLHKVLKFRLAPDDEIQFATSKRTELKYS